MAVALANPVTGDAPLTVQFNSDNSYDQDGTIVGYLWQSGSRSSTNPNPSYTFTDPGTYNVTLEVTDNDSSSGTDVVTIQVNAPTVHELHSGGQVVTREYYSGKWMAVDAVLVLDQNNQPVANALVTTNYDGPRSSSVTGITGSDGIVELSSGSVKKPRGNWCFEITYISKSGYNYNPNDNVVTIQCEGLSLTKTKSGIIGIEKDGFTKSEFLETSVYPNPFGTEITLQFELEKEQPISAKIFDISGKVVRILANNKNIPAGIHFIKWNGLSDSGQLLNEGMYFLQLV